MKKIAKRLELKRETVRALVMKTGLRTGGAEPDMHGTQGSQCCIPDTGSVSGIGGGRDGVGASDPKIGLTIIGPPSGGKVPSPDV